MTGKTPALQFPFGMFSLEYLAGEAFAMLKEAGDVAEDALEQIEQGTYDAAAWSQSMVDLIGISLTRYAECAEKALGEVDDGPVRSVEMRVDGDDDNARRPQIVSMTRVGRPDVTIPEHLISFDPPVLPFGATRFQICVSSPKYSGHSYDVVVYLHKLGVNPSGPDGPTVEDTVAL